jgi:hypothetical protein
MTHSWSADNCGQPVGLMVGERPQAFKGLVAALQKGLTIACQNAVALDPDPSRIVVVSSIPWAFFETESLS